MVERRAGRSAGRCLEGWRKARAEGLLQGWEIYGQPAAVVDGVILSWMLEKQAEAFPASVWCRDSLAAGATPEVLLKQAACQQIGCSIAPGVTDLVQPTDTDFAASFKSSLKSAGAEERKKQKAEAKMQGTEPTFQCGVLEIARILETAWAAQKSRELQTAWPLKALRRNGFLHWRPSWSSMKMMKAAEQDWAAELNEDSHRLPVGYWRKRGELLTDAGKPTKQLLEYLASAERRAEEAEAQCCREEGYVVETAAGKKLDASGCALDLEAIGDDLKADAASYWDCLDPKVKRRLQKATDKVAPPPKEVRKKKKKATSRLKRRVLLSKGKEMLQKCWRRKPGLRSCSCCQ